MKNITRGCFKFALVFSFVLAAVYAFAQDTNTTEGVSSASNLGGLSTEYDPSQENNPYQGGYQTSDAAHDFPQPDFSPAATPVENPDEAGYLDTNFEPEIVQGSFKRPPAIGSENPYREYGALSDSSSFPSSTGAGYSRESDLIGEKSTTYQPESPYSNE